MRVRLAAVTVTLCLALGLVGCMMRPVPITGQASSTPEKEATADTHDSEVKAPAPQAISRGPERNAAFMLPGFSHTLAWSHEVDGRQGIAWSKGAYYVSGSTSLSRYDTDWKLQTANDDPFTGLSDEINHLGDIDVYEGRIYASAERFLDGKASNIQIAVYDAQTLGLVRTFPFDETSGQTECSGIAIDPDSKSIWLCSWEGDESGRYLYRYDLESGGYLGKVHLQAPPQWIQGIAYYEGWLYLTADDGTADLDEPDHVWRCRVDVSKTAWPVCLERTLDDVTQQGEVEGISFDPAAKQMLVSYNRGAQIVLGMPKGFYEGYDAEVHEVFAYDLARTTAPLDYALDESWAELPQTTDKNADTFFILPVVDMHATVPDNEGVFNLRGVARFTKTLAMERGIVAEATNVFAPLYRQATIGCFLGKDGTLDTSAPRIDGDSPYADLAYQDVRDAFTQFLAERNEGRPFVLFGFSQGADMVLRLVAELGDDESFAKGFVAAYTIGTTVTEKYVAEHPAVHMAQDANDTGVVVCYNAIDERATKPTVKQLAINPLNWHTDSTKAEADLNLGYVTCDTDGRVTKDEPGFCGAYVDEASGSLVVCDMKSDELYNAEAGVFQKGDYHLFDLALFYRNLQQNVKDRIAAFSAP